MKHIQKYFISLATLALLLLAAGCEDTFDKFLTHEPYAEGDASAKFWTNPNNLQSAVDALNRFSSEEGVTGRGIMWLENAGDNLVTGRPRPTADQIKMFQMSPDNSNDVKDTWPAMFQTIAQANSILKFAPDMDVDPSIKNKALGAAHFYRALAYLWLAPWYGDNGPNGGLPIITENTPVEEMDMPRPKSVLENYDFIIEDCRIAGDLLPLFSEQADVDYGRPWKAAAWGIGARAALYAAQYDAKYYDVVIDFCNKIMSLTGKDKRDLYPDFTTLFTVENNFTSEYIFSLFGSAETKAGPKFHGMSWQKDGWGLFNTWGYYQPTLELFKAYEEGDLRRAATILIPGQKSRFMSQDITLAVSPANVSSTSGMLFCKWISPFREATNATSLFYPDGNFQSNRLGMIVVRYADIMLMKAEALIWKNGEGDAEAKRLLNAIRTRAGLPANSQATKQQLKNERRCELAFEFCTPRFVDVVRWKDYDLLEAPLHGYDAGYFTETGMLKEIEIFPSRSFDPNKNHVFPIPEREVKNSKNLTQNIGY